MSRKSGLGKGLDALIPQTPEGQSSWDQPSTLPAGGIIQVPVGNIERNPRQPRTRFDPEEIGELADSIKEHGVIQPLIVTQGQSDGQYVLIAGERRLQAAQQAGLENVPVIIREATQEEFLLLALIENLQRADLSPLETAAAYKHLVEEFNLTQEQVAERVGKSRVAVTNTLSLLDLSDKVKEALADGLISAGHANALKGLSKPQQSAALKTVIDKQLSVRQTEELARKLKGEKSPPKPKAALPPELAEIQTQLRNALGTKVNLTYGKKGGTIVVHYYSDEELNHLIDKLSGEAG